MNSISSKNKKCERKKKLKEMSVI